MSVVFPAPLVPAIPSVSPFESVKEISFNTSFFTFRIYPVVKDFEICCTSKSMGTPF